MSQRGKNIYESHLINLKVEVKLDYLSNHNGFTEQELKNAEEEFADEITNWLYQRLEGEYQGEDFLQCADMVNFRVVQNR